MRAHVFWPGLLALALGFAGFPLSRSMAQQAPDTGQEQNSTQAEEPATAEKPESLVGTVVAVDSGSQTLVVDVPLGKETLRVGASITPDTKIEAGGKNLSIENLQEGSRVRLNFQRVETGDQALAVDVLGGAKG